MGGIARIKLGAEPQWHWINFNLLGPDLLKSEAVVPQIAVDPANGDVYCLMTGVYAPDTPRHSANQARTGIWRMPRGGASWTLLRGAVALPPELAGERPWQYPTGGSLGGRVPSTLPASVLPRCILKTAGRRPRAARLPACLHPLCPSGADVARASRSPQALPSTGCRARPARGPSCTLSTRPAAARR